MIIKENNFNIYAPNSFIGDFFREKYLPVITEFLENHIGRNKFILNVSVEDKKVVLIDDVLFTGRSIRAAMDALNSWGRPKRVMLLAMVDRGHRELPIQPDFCGKKVPTRKNEIISLRLNNVDNEEGVFLE